MFTFTVPKNLDPTYLIISKVLDIKLITKLIRYMELKVVPHITLLVYLPLKPLEVLMYRKI